jgi:hypothetical protein
MLKWHQLHNQCLNKNMECISWELCKLAMGMQLHMGGYCSSSSIQIIFIVLQLHLPLLIFLNVSLSNLVLIASYIKLVNFDKLSKNM